MTRLYDIAIEKKSIFPMWVFTDPHYGTQSGGKFMAFVGANWPVKIVSATLEAQAEALLYLTSGNWKARALEQDPEKKMVGYGFGNTPSEAFRNACFMSGHMTRVQT